MKFRMLFNINNLLLESFNECIAAEFTISNDSKIRRSFYTDEVLLDLGKSETRHREDKAFAYFEMEYNPNGEEDSITILEDKMMEKLQFLEGFLLMFWLVKESCVYVNHVLGYIEDIKGSVRSLNNNSFAWNNKGKQDYTSFSKEEFRQVDELCSNLARYNKLDPQRILNNRVPNEPIKIGTDADFSYGDYGPIQRAIVFLLSARKVSYIPHRIALFMPIFECLLTNDSSEVTQKMSERAAFYLTEDKAKRREIFKTVRDAYKMRSNFLHGNTYTSTQLKPTVHKPLIEEVEGYCKNLIKKIILYDGDKFLNVNETERTEFLNNIIFEY